MYSMQLRSRLYMFASLKAFPCIAHITIHGRIVHMCDTWWSSGKGSGCASTTKRTHTHACTPQHGDSLTPLDALCFHVPALHHRLKANLSQLVFAQLHSTCAHSSVIFVLSNLSENSLYLAVPCVSSTIVHSLCRITLAT